MKVLTAKLDKIAGDLEAIGLERLAEDIDTVSNALENVAPPIPVTAKPVTELKMKKQPDDVTCGPSCLTSVYDFYGMNIPQEQVIKTVQQVPGGGTAAVYLGLHALSMGLKVKIYTYDLLMFDPTWKTLDKEALAAKLLLQKSIHKEESKFESVSDAYIEFLQKGGEISFEEMTKELLSIHFMQGSPIITGLSCTWLYQSSREFTGPNNISIMDDIKGEPMGHFVVLHGFDATDSVMIADPSSSNPFTDENSYSLPYNSVCQSIMLGVLTYDANLLVIKK